MSDLISRQDAIDALVEMYCKSDEDGYVWIIRGDACLRIDALPSVDAVEVVRCKDCRWWDKREESNYGYCHAAKHGYYSRNWEISIYRTYSEDFFCADGERKGEEDER